MLIFMFIVLVPHKIDLHPLKAQLALVMEVSSG
jgi:hypothetical protein